MLFYMMLINTITQIVYILYVFFTIRIYQEIPERRVTKLEFVPYRLVVQNEGLIAYRDIRLQFIGELSELKSMEKEYCISMEPGQGMEVHGELLCKYSGTYFVGVDSIEIMDYFKIFRIRFQMPQKMKVMVRPRVLCPESMNFLREEETHDSSLFGNSEYRLDHEVRRYYPGDNKKYIHWKNSAKRRELMVRTRTAEEVSEYVVIMDSSMGELSMEEKIICCDKLRESMLALVNYIYISGYRVHIFLDDTAVKEIAARRDFDSFLQCLIDYGFGQTQGIGESLDRLLAEYGGEIPVIVVQTGHSLKKDQDSGQLDGCHRVHIINVDRKKTVEELFQSEK